MPHDSIRNDPESRARNMPGFHQKDTRLVLETQPILYIVFQKNWYTKLISITSSILNAFSKFFHWHTPWKIRGTIIIKDPTTPNTRRYTTL